MLDLHDYRVQVTQLLPSSEGSEAGMAFVAALYSLLTGKAVFPGLLTTGQITIQGYVSAIQSLAQALQVAMDHGAKRVLIPVESKRQFLEIPGEIIETVDPIFYSDPLRAAVKALGVN